MEPLSLDPLLSVDEAEARAADDVNDQRLGRLAFVAGLASAVVALAYFVVEERLGLAVALGGVLLAVAVALGRETFLARWSRLTCLVYLLAQLGIGILLLEGLDPLWRVAFLVLVFPIVTLFFHLRGAERALLLLPSWIAGVTYWVTGLPGLWRVPAGYGGYVWPTVAIGLVAIVSGVVGSSRRRSFRATWRQRAAAGREQARLRDEIESARQIQLDLLPRSAPRVAWLEVSRVSMPASEVGGDYYDYVDLPGSSLALIVADVAGHGLASGLMLSGLRSCLVLLEEELAKPAVVIERLHRMVQRTTRRRMFVTVLCAYFDGARRTVTLASGGHPPTIHFRPSTGEAREISLPAPPLGTRLEVVYRQETLQLAPRDVLVFYTDGLTETRDAAGVDYGSERLLEVVASVGDQPVREIRNAILGDLSSFKGDALREDDVTLLVVRVR